MSTNDSTPIIDEVALAAGCQIAKTTRGALLRLIQIGAVRGRYDGSRTAGAGRWFISRADCERVRSEQQDRARQRAIRLAEREALRDARRAERRRGMRL